MGNGVPDCPFGNDCHYSHQLERGVDYVFSAQQLAAQRHRRSGRRAGEGSQDPLSPLQMGWVERILLGDYDTTGDHALPAPAWPASEEDARAIMEVFLESHAAEWEEYDDDDDEVDDDDVEEEFYDDNDEYDPYYEDTDFEADHSEHELEAEISRVFTLGDGPLSQAYRDSLSRTSPPSPPHSPWASARAEVGGEGAGRRRWNRQHEAPDDEDDVPALVDVVESE